MTKTPLVVRWNPDSGQWNVTTGKQGVIETDDGQTTVRQKADSIALKQNRPGVIVLTRDGDIRTISENRSYWRDNSWTNEHPGPLVVTPTTDGRWAVKRGRYTIIDTYQTKGEAFRNASIMADDDVPAIVTDAGDGDYHDVDLRPEYWRRWV